jgi:hypothetical protein
MPRFTAIVLASTLAFSSAFAAQTDSSTPLAPGNPAGVKQAQLAGNGLLFVFGLAVVAGGLALVVSNGSSGGNITTTTTSTAP